MYNSDLTDYEPSPSDLEELRYSLLFLRILETLKEIRNGLNLSRPTIGVYLRGDFLYTVLGGSKMTAMVTMSDTDLLLEATTEHLLKGMR